MKQCIKCNKEKEDSEYHKRPSGVLYNTCKECKNKYYKERHYKLSQNIEWRVMRSEVNKKRYHAKKKHSVEFNEVVKQTYGGNK